MSILTLSQAFSMGTSFSVINNHSCQKTLEKCYTWMDDLSQRRSFTKTFLIYMYVGTSTWLLIKLRFKQVAVQPK